jgi:cytochrome b pre-mRNA-processing protein 3
MLSRLLGRGRSAPIAPALYEAIIDQARAPALFSDLGVPDTVSGRFEMVVLHLFLVVHRLRQGGEQANAAGQGAFDLFCTDMDRSLRELGVGDLGVPKRMRRVGEAFYGRTQAYADCIARADGQGLALALARNVFKDASDDQMALPLARYAQAVAASLDAVPPEALIAGPIAFPDPGRFAATPAGAPA